MKRKDQSVQFSGLLDRPSTAVELQVYDYRLQKWTRFEQAVTDSTEPLSFGNNRTWFWFSTRIKLPQSVDYWVAGGKDAIMKARVRAVSQGRLLSSFTRDAESCIRKAQLQGYNEDRTLKACESPISPAVELFVTSCGDAGNACCDYYGASKRDRCEQALVCQGGTCRQPPYPVPIVPSFQVDIPATNGSAIRDAWIELEDKAVGRNTGFKLLSDFKPVRGVSSSRPHPSIARLVFDLPLWRPGINRFRIRGFLVGKATRHRFATGFHQITYELPPGFGLIGPGHFRLPERHFPMGIGNCQTLFCKDADGDGLNDLWENVALQQLRPRLMMDSNDELFNPKYRRDAVRLLSSVYPLKKSGERYILFAHAIAFSRDYGPPSLYGFDHPGDTEAWGIAYRVDRDQGLHWEASIAKGHDCLTCKPSWRWHSQDFSRDGVPLVFVEEDKHGLWQSGRLCGKESAFSCRGDRSLRPVAINVGDYRKTGVRALVDSLDNLAIEGAYGELAGVFPGEAVWSAALARIFGRFCGGVHQGCSRQKSANLPGNVIATLAKKFEAKGWRL
ncbi:MAG: hypothetical protein JXA30_15785 [Deltaproteobacteria bacterium]|nr:hypothetical protein [Deltaproteobacteria bacterium]